MRFVPPRPFTGGTADRPKRFRIEAHYTSPHGSGMDVEPYSPGLHGRIPYPDTAQRILAQRQSESTGFRRYHHVAIIDKGSHLVVSEAGTPAEAK